MFWRIHPKIFDTRIKEAVGILESMGDTCVLVDSLSALTSKPAIVDAEASLCMTTIHDAMKNKAYGVPWLYFDKDKYNVSSWLPRAGFGHAVNDDTIFLPFSMLGVVSNLFPKGTRLFVRPDSGCKSFVGCEVSMEAPCRDIINYNRTSERWSIDDDILCAVTTFKEMPEHEFRFWIVNGMIVASSSYSHTSELYVSVPGRAHAFVHSYLKNGMWEPDISYVIDVAMVDGRFLIVEYNATSTSGVYNAYLKELFKSLKSAAEKEFKENIDIEEQS